MSAAATVPACTLSAIEAVEQAGLASWPALEEERMDGWLLRASRGYTRRTNSANSAGALADRLEASLPLIERFFVQRGLPPTFRLLSIPEDEAIDDALARHGYQACDNACSVMVLTLAGHAPRSSESSHPVKPLADAKAWLREFTRIKDDAGPHQKVHLAMLQAITQPTAFAVVQAEGASSAIGCGLGVVSNGHLGLFDIATQAVHRRQGVGTALCNGLLHWGRSQGAHTAYLQVVAHNHQAVELYRRLGFEELYRYWYRTRG